MNELGLLVRPMVSDDLPYVARSWLMSITERDDKGKRRRGYQRRKEYDKQTPRVATLIERCLVWCAIHPDAPATVHGFLVVEHDGRVQFLFVPRALRHQGIEELLCNHAQAKPVEVSECNASESAKSSSNPPSHHPAAA